METYKYKKSKSTSLLVNNSNQGETIETKVERIVTLKEPIKDGAPLIYTERKNGVAPEYNIRTDRFEIAVDAMDLVQKNAIAKREARMKIVKDEPNNNNELGETQATN